MSSNRPLIKRATVILGVVVGINALSILTPYPKLSNIIDSKYSLPILDSSGIRLFTVPLNNGLKREIVDSSLLRPELKKVVLESEDRYFYFHLGVNPISVIRTIIINRQEKRVVAGASTISMQLARIITPRNKSLKSKFLEMLDAVRLEAKLSKREILTLYLSHLPFGNNIEGYASAAKFYYGKNLRDLTVDEIRVLSIIPRSPKTYDPVKNPKMVINAINRAGIDDRDFSKILVDIKESSLKPKDPIIAPHFVNYIRGELTDNDYKSGLPIKTTLDLDTQLFAEDLVKYYLDKTRDNRISNASLLLLNRGAIIAYIGSGNFYNVENKGQIDGVQILRQPGSTLKPFLYGKALEMGFTLSTPLPDIPMTFGSIESYRPENYSQTYHGPVRVRDALGSSLNIPAVYTLERIGVDNFINRLKDLGFNSLKGQEESLGLGLSVGNAEVSLYELVRAFSVFKNRGYLQETYWRDLDRVEPKIRVMGSESSGLIRSAISDKTSRVLGFGRNSVLNTNYPAYFKTGTSNQFNNIWALGATMDLTCGVWMGNFDGKTVIGRPGSSTPALIVETLLDEFSTKEEFPAIEGVESLDICALSGGLYTKNCSVKLSEFFKIGSAPKKCNYHFKDGVVKLPSVYSEWMNLYSYDGYYFNSNSSEVEMIYPIDGSVYYLSPDVPFISQGVEFKIVGSGNFSLNINNKPYISGSLPYQEIHNLGKGEWNIELITDSGIERSFIIIN